MLHGVIPVKKAAGMTSHDVVARIRRLAGQKRVGHTGTLDPDVVGVLPICLGQATRIAEYVQHLPKRYQGTLVLGRATDTQDASGETIAEVAKVDITLDQIDEAFSRFIGEIEQMPPMVSAVKVDGRRLYEYAREGKEVKRSPRKAMIYSLERIDFTEGEQPRIDFDVWCSKGTYVRTLCVDIGESLGVPAHMSHLVRMNSGPFTLEDCFTLEELAEVAFQNTWESVLTGPGEALPHFPSIILSDEDYGELMNGLSVEWEEDEPLLPESVRIRVYTEDGRFCGLYRQVDERTADPEKVFREW
ncbi:tRNA pseudouridine55 synthase [Marininema mesophilum]|uniref:tRNA pseudouridine synthase B n=1 Tax=Marininema mesophilum TaxID=1048340 RepID=A0A1H2SLW7_9BACL|nr:tRNA pseudouridine(55) synthase TruB [Marininema mesophilum]SDW32616.1 tRNA pseudouridine55 synthase [Marininema mesophilum]